MSASVAAPSPTPRWLPLLVLAAALAANIGFSLVGLNHTLLGSHQFRQTQTAISSYYLLQDGMRLDYATPILGEPWQVPLEFPLYQLAAAAVTRGTGLPLDAAGRVTSWLFFASALPAAFLLLARFRIQLFERLAFLALLVTSPLYLFYSRAFLIESTTLAAGLWFLCGCSRASPGRSVRWMLVAWVAGAALGAVKSTTFVVYFIGAMILLGADVMAAARPERRRRIGRAGLLLLVPGLLTVAWTAYAALIRHRNPEAAFLDDAFGAWSFGHLGQRFSIAFWTRAYWAASNVVLSEAGVLLICLYFLRRSTAHRGAVLATLLTGAAGWLLFANLYGVHDYYYYASGVFLVAALGFTLTDESWNSVLPGRARWAVIALVCLLQLGTYARNYLPYQRQATPVPDEPRLLAQLVRPDEMIVVLGEDWDPSMPYYAGRRALMLASGREQDPEHVRRSVARLDPAKVGAVVLHGAFWRDQALVQSLFARLQLGAAPLFHNGRDIGIWVPAPRAPELRDRIDLAGFPSFHLTPEVVGPGQTLTLLERALSVREEFAGFTPRPVRAVSEHGFALGEVGGQKVLNAHVTSELVFRVPAGAHTITAMFGIAEGAYTGTGNTDGVEYVIAERTADGREHVLYRRLLNPKVAGADQGPQHLRIDVSTSGGEISFKTLPGPQKNSSFDWSYWGPVTIR
jgi:hypothetical protein